MRCTAILFARFDAPIRNSKFRYYSVLIFMSCVNKMAASKQFGVWEHFKFKTTNHKEDRTNTVCKLCGTPFRYYTGSTSFLSAHLKKIHNVIITSERKIDENDNIKSKSTRSTRITMLLTWSLLRNHVCLEDK
mgnify:CR=1 FL=1